jgi:hypothetical protein
MHMLRSAAHASQMYVSTKFRIEESIGSSTDTKIRGVQILIDHNLA